MRNRPRPCIGLPGVHCAALTVHRSGRCDRCRRVADRQRGASSQRGYGPDHRRLRQQLAPIVAAGQAICARCGKRIQPGQPWDLDHSDHDRRRYIGPSHAACNRQTSLHRHEDRCATTAPALQWFNTTPRTGGLVTRRYQRGSPSAQPTQPVTPGLTCTWPWCARPHRAFRRRDDWTVRYRALGIEQRTAVSRRKTLAPAENGSVANSLGLGVAPLASWRSVYRHRT